MSNTDCTVTWIDVWVLEIVLLSFRDYFHKSDLYLWVKQRENNSVLETLWFCAILSSTSPICKPSCSVTTPSAFFKLSFSIFLYTLKYMPRVTLCIGISLPSCFKKSLARNLEWLLWYSAMVWLWYVVWRWGRFHWGSLIFILPQYTANLDTTEKITQ